MPLYRITKTTTRYIVAYAETQPSDAQMRAWMADAVRVDGATTIEDDIGSDVLVSVPPKWDGALIWHDGDGDLTAGAGLKRAAESPPATRKP